MIDDQCNTSHLIPLLPEIVLRTDFDIFWGPESKRMYHHIILYKKLFSDRYVILLRIMILQKSHKNSFFTFQYAPRTFLALCEN